MCLPKINKSSRTMAGPNADIWQFPIVNLVAVAAILNFIQRFKHFSQATNFVYTSPNLALIIFRQISLMFRTFHPLQSINFAGKTGSELISYHGQLTWNLLWVHEGIPLTKWHGVSMATMFRWIAWPPHRWMQLKLVWFLYYFIVTFIVGFFFHSWEIKRRYALVATLSLSTDCKTSFSNMLRLIKQNEGTMKKVYSWRLTVPYISLCAYATSEPDHHVKFFLA